MAPLNARTAARHLSTAPACLPHRPLPLPLPPCIRSSAGRCRPTASGTRGQRNPGPSARAVPDAGESAEGAEYQLLEQDLLASVGADEGDASDTDDDDFTGSNGNGGRGGSSWATDAEGVRSWSEDLEEGGAEGEGALTVDELVQAGLDANAPLRQLCRLFPFKLDGFQRKSVAHLLAGKNVVVCAPTGAGKTCIAEAAAAAMLAQGKRVIYTTPLKALSNQKLFEMRATFGEARLGLQTGDASLNADGDVVVMTTEILRNILYRPPEADGSSSAQARLGDVGLVVLDEVHYLGDPNRGSVWEEVIISCPPHIQMLAMSATVKNPRDVGGWIQQVHGECETVITRFRPIPLKWSFCFNGDDGDAELLPLMDKKQRRLHPAVTKALMRSRFSTTGGFSSRGQGLSGRALPSVNVQSAVKKLKQQDMLPAIVFIFSRRDCDQAVQKMAALPKLKLTTGEEQARLRVMYEELEASQPESVRRSAVQAFLKGVAAHHAGMLPGWKKLIETAFQQGLLKAVFATETLAAGINMPARTTVISVVSRKMGPETRMLKHNEIVQMAGRAGRRGFDDIGHAVIMQSRWDGAVEAFEILQRGPEMLTSQFSTSYSLVLNLLATRSLDEARVFVERSFGNYLGGEGLRRRTAEIEEIEARSMALLAKAAQVEQDEASMQDGQLEPIMQEYTELRAAQKTSKKQLRLLRKKARNQRANLVCTLLAERGGLPACVGLDLPRDDEGVVKSWEHRMVGDRDEREQELSQAYVLRELTIEEAAMMPGGATPSMPAYLVISSDNQLLALAGHHIAAVAELGPLAEFDPERYAQYRFDIRHNAWRQLSSDCFAMAGTNATATVAIALANVARHAMEPVLLDEELLDEMAAVIEQIVLGRTEIPKLKARLPDAVLSSDQLPQTRKNSDKSSAQDLEERAEKLAGRAGRMRAALQEQLGASWVCFQEMVDILVEFDALRPGDLSALPLGEVAREIRGENELWLAACLTHPAVQDLPPAPLAGLVAGLVAAESMRSRANIYVGYMPSQAVLHTAAELEELQDTLTALQMRTSLVSCSPQVDFRFSGLVEAWVAGAGWFEVTEDTSLDEGDLARLLGRTADLLRQITFISHLLPDLRDSAQKALKAMNRSPISELVA